MKKIKSAFLIISLLTASVISFAQTEDGPIMLRGYKCFFYDDQSTNVPEAMYKGNDTFIFYLFTRDVWTVLGADNRESTPQNELKVGLELCFDGVKYIRTKDSLYIATWKEDNVYQYIIYVPEQMISVCVRSNKNDPDFSEKSKWLLSQVRLNRKKNIFFINEKHQNCMDPFHPAAHT